MNAQIDKILDTNDIDKERIVIKILADLDIGRYGVFRTGTNERGITNKIFDAYWFPDKLVKAGDIIVLYSRQGVSTEASNEDGSTSHFFYWGKSSLLWNNGSGCVLVSIPEWRVYHKG